MDNPVIVSAVRTPIGKFLGTLAGIQAPKLGAIAVSCRRHANLHPGAVMREKKLSLADYLARPMLVDPLRVEDCCLISDGGGAYLMTSVERARDLAKQIGRAHV